MEHPKPKIPITYFHIFFTSNAVCSQPAVLHQKELCQSLNLWQSYAPLRIGYPTVHQNEKLPPLKMNQAGKKKRSGLSKHIKKIYENVKVQRTGSSLFYVLFSSPYTSNIRRLKG